VVAPPVYPPSIAVLLPETFDWVDPACTAKVDNNNIVREIKRVFIIFKSQGVQVV
jgi:hypothetical protein